MHNPKKSAGQPVFASSSAAPHGQPAQAPGATAPVWLSSLLQEVGHHALNVRNLLGRMLDDPNSADALNLAASNLVAVVVCSKLSRPPSLLNLAASNLVSVVGMLADTGLTRMGEPGVLGGTQDWVIDLYMAQYDGRDNTRTQRLDWWRVHLGHLTLAEATDDHIHAALEDLAHNPAVYFAGLDAQGKRIFKAKRKTLSPALGAVLQQAGATQ